MAHLLPQAIESILDNTFQNIELIIIDDGSTDSTEAVIAKSRKETNIAIRYHRVSHRGKSACLNQIFDHLSLKGEYIIFMDADDVLPADSLQNRYRAIVSLDADIIIGEFTVTNLRGDVLEVRELAGNITNDELLSHFFFSPKTPFHLNSTIIAKELFYKTGMFDESLSRGQEVDYSIRLLKKATNFGIFPEVVYHYRKYNRPWKTRLNIRLQTMRCRWRIINEHTNGIPKIGAIIWHTLLDSLKLVYEQFRSYK